MIRFVRRAAKAAAFLCVPILFAACGGGGGDSSTATTPTREFLLALAGPGADGTMTFANGPQGFRTYDIVAVDLAAPDKGVVTVETAAFDNRGLSLSSNVEATFGNGVISDSRTRNALYFKGGRLYRLDTRVAGTGLPVPRQVSALQSSEVCATGGAVDLDNVYGDPRGAGSDWVFIPAPGADGVCDTADDGTRAVRLDMDAKAVPRTVGKPLAGLYDRSTLAFQGVVVQSGDKVQRLDPDLTSAEHLFDIDASTFSNRSDTTGDDGRTSRWLFVEAGTLWAVDLASPSVRTPVIALAAGETVAERSWAAAAGTFVQVDTPTSSRIVRIDAAGVAATVLTSPLPLTQFVVTPTQLVWVTAGGVNSAPLAGGAAATVLAAGQGESIAFVLNTGETVWVSRRRIDPLDATRTLVDTLVVGSTGNTLATFTDTAILSFVLPRQISLSAPLDGFSVIVAEGVASDGDYRGASLRAYRGDVPALLTTYGTVPPDPAAAFVATTEPTYYGRPGLFLAYDRNIDGPAISDAIDLYYFDSDAPGLTRLTRHLPLAGQGTGFAAEPASPGR